MSPLTDAQQKVYEFVRGHQQTKGYPPTRAEVAKHFGFMPNAAECHLVLIERKGWIRIHRGIARGIEVMQPEPNQANEPVGVGA